MALRHQLSVEGGALQLRPQQRAAGCPCLTLGVRVFLGRSTPDVPNTRGPGVKTCPGSTSSVESTELHLEAQGKFQTQNSA